MSLKIALLSCTHPCIYVACTPPTTRATSEEQVNYREKRDIKNGVFAAPNVMAIMAQTVLHLVNFIELAGVIVSTYPSLAPRGFGYAARMEGAHLHPWFLLGVCVMYLGALLRALSYHYLGRFFTYELALRDDHKLVTNGPYGIVRHPGYTAGLLFAYGGALAHLGPGSYWYEVGWWHNTTGLVIGVFYLSWVALGTRLVFSRILLEDAVLRQTFPAQWDIWAKRTPYKLFPGVY